MDVPTRGPWDLSGAPADITAGVARPGGEFGRERADRTLRVAIHDPREIQPAGGESLEIGGFLVPIGGTAWQVIAGQRVQQSSRGILRSLAVTVVGSITAATRVQFRVTRNSAAVTGWANIQVPAIPATSVSVAFPPEQTYIDLSPNMVVQLEVQVNDGGTYSVQASARGWTWSGTL